MKNGRLAKRRDNMWSLADCTLDFVFGEVERARAALAPYREGFDSELPADAVTAAAEAFGALDELTRYLPPVMGWCVVKHYAPSGDDDRTWRPAIWVACTTKAQADSFAVAIAGHYDAEAKAHGWRKDRFLVEQRAARISDFVAPSLDAGEYVKGLGR